MDHHTDRISENDFRRLAGLIGTQCGIVISPGKRIMIETRLAKRVRCLGLKSISAYCEYVHSSPGGKEEWPHLVDAITTHKTDFFREPAHFDFLVDQALPELAAECGAGTRRPLFLWSAACSTGEEPYTLAMVLARYREAVGNFDFRIEATDISEAVVEAARQGIYTEAVVRPVPDQLRRTYLLRSRDRSQKMVRIAPEIRAHIHFRQQNLMDADYGFTDPLDVVMCRNVMIYFDRATQQKVLSRICRTLRPGGYLLMGHSESLNGLELPLIQVAPTVYRRFDG